MNKFKYECTSEVSGCLQKRFDGILFSSLLHVIPKVSVLNRNTALSTEFTGNSCNSAAPSAPPAVSEWIYRDLYLHSVCVQFLSGQKWTKLGVICVSVLFEHLQQILTIP